MCKLMHYEEHDIIGDAIKAIGIAFPHLPDKQQARRDLCKLSTYDYEGRQKVIEVLGSLFSYVPDKKQTLSNLYELTKYEDKEEDSDIRPFAYHSLGNVFIFNASVHRCRRLQKRIRDGN